MARELADFESSQSIRSRGIIIEYRYDSVNDSGRRECANHVN